MPCQDCNELLEGPVNWAIPGGVLNSLWGDMLPRLVALRWYVEVGGANPPPPPGPPNWDDLAPGLPAPDLGELIDSLPNGTAEFNARRATVSSYLKASSCTIPIFFHELDEGGFDFLLSEHGMEVFLPERADDGLDLIRFYTYRRTGRRALGVPDYLVDGTAGIATEAATGPGQILVDPSVLADILDDDPACLNEVLQCFKQFPVVEVDPEVTPSSVRGHHADDAGEAVPAKLQKGQEGQSVAGSADRANGRTASRTMSSSAYSGVMEGARCWQVSGAVYRGISVELPRVVAICWLEQGSCKKPAPAVFYYQMFSDPTDQGLREIFRERLETALPDDEHMVFRTHPSSPPETCGTEWDPDDLMVTNLGFYVPKLPNAPAEADIYQKIGSGEAGNPVFTDSMRST